MSAIYEKNAQSEAFNLLVKMLKESLVLTAKATHQGEVRYSAFRTALERYAAIFGRASYQLMPLVHLFESAIYGEASLVYEYQHAVSLLGTENPLRKNYLAKALIHRNLIEELFNTARRTHNLLINNSYPYVMPYRVFFIFPYSKEVELLLNQQEDYFALWDKGIVALIAEDKLETIKKKASEILLLSYDADEILNQSLSEPELHEIWTVQLRAARMSVHLGNAGEAFPDHINRCLLHQNTILINLLPRLNDEHSKAQAYLAPFVEASIAELQEHLLENPFWTSKRFKGTKDSKSKLISLEKRIDTHIRQWIEKGEKNDAVGLLSQFKAILQANSPLNN